MIKALIMLVLDPKGNCCFFQHLLMAARWN